MDIPRSQYYFDPSGTAAQNWNLVMQINAQTFSLATPQPSRGNVLFTATLGPQNNPVPGARPYHQENIYARRRWRRGGSTGSGALGAGGLGWDEFDVLQLGIPVVSSTITYPKAQ